jgi:hypothetical protein
MKTEALCFYSRSQSSTSKIIHNIPFQQKFSIYSINQIGISFHFQIHPSTRQSIATCQFLGIPSILRKIAFRLTYFSNISLYQTKAHSNNHFTSYIFMFSFYFICIFLLLPVF